MKKLFCILFTIHFSLFIVVVQAQENIDSLLSVLKTAKEDVSKVNTLNAVAAAFKSNDPDTAIYFAGKALMLAQKINFKTGIAEAQLYTGMAFTNNGKYTEAIKSTNAAIATFSNLLSIAKGHDKADAEINRVNAYNNLGIIYWRIGNYPDAVKNLFTSLKIAEEIKDTADVAAVYLNIGNIYYDQGDFPDALKNFSEALKIFQEIKDKQGIAYAYNNIGGIYYQQGNYDETLKSLFAALEIRKELGDKNDIAQTYSGIGGVYYQQLNFAEALNYNLKALKIKEEIGNKQGMALDYSNIGSIYLQLHKTREAYSYLNKSFDLAREIGSLIDMKESAQSLSRLDSAEGNFKESLHHYKQYIFYRDSMFNEENTKKTVQIQMQYEFDKKEALTKSEQEKKDAIALKELQRQKLVRNGFVGGFAVVFLFAGVFFTQRNKIRKGKKRSDELLLNILPEEVAEELKAKGSADAKQFDDVTVMFTDFKNFTQISEKLSPTELVNEIHTCFKAFDNIISRYNIEKIKTIGDSYMCAGGLPVLNKTNAIDVVSAAIDIQNFIQQHSSQRKNEGKEIFEIRIGIHTGPVVAGIVGIKKFAYDIWGDTVNIASRMESSGEAGKVNISGSTYELVKDKFNCIYRGKIEAKNKEMIDMYFVSVNSE